MSLADHERRLREIERYLPNLERLDGDQVYRDRVVSTRRGRWRFATGLAGALAACATFGVAVAALGAFLLHLL